MYDPIKLIAQRIHPRLIVWIWIVYYVAVPVNDHSVCDIVYSLVTLVEQLGIHGSIEISAYPLVIYQRVQSESVQDQR